MRREQIQQIIISKDSYENKIKRLLPELANEDGTIRDDLVFNSIEEWIEAGSLDEKALSSILDTILDEAYLDEKNSTILRSFSMLTIATILAGLNETNSTILSEAQEERVWECLTACYQSEKNYVGYAEKYGWIHFVAHGADAFRELFRYKVWNAEKIAVVLRLFTQKICQGEYVFIDREPNRIIFALEVLIQEQVWGDQSVIDWLESLQNPYEDTMAADYFHSRVNIENFCRCLYFALEKYESYKAVQRYLMNRLEE